MSLTRSNCMFIFNLKVTVTSSNTLSISYFSQWQARMYHILSRFFRLPYKVSYYGSEIVCFMVMRASWPVSDWTERLLIGCAYYEVAAIASYSFRAQASILCL